MSHARFPSRPRRVAWLALGVAVFLSRGARSQPHDSLAADALFTEGRRAVDRGDYAAACPKFAESLRLEAAPGTLLNLADCEERLGRIGSAWVHFRQLLDVVSPDDPRAAFAREHADSLDKRVPRLTIALAEATPPGARVLRDDVELGAPTLGVPLPADPGDHVLVAKEDGHVDATFRVQLAEGETRQVTLSVGPPVPPASPPTPNPRPHDAETAAPTGRNPLPWVVGAGSAVVLVAGAVFGIAALSKKAASDQGCSAGLCSRQVSVDDYDDAKNFAHVADVCLGVGFAGLGVATYLLLTSHPAAPSVASWRVLPSVRTRGGGLALAGAW